MVHYARAVSGVSLGVSGIATILLLGLPLAPAQGQRLLPAAATSAWHERDSVVPSPGGERPGLASRGDHQRVLKGIAAGASAGVVTGLLVWAVRTIPKAIACDVRNYADGIGGDYELEQCNWHAYRRRAQLTWSGLVLGGAIGGVVGRLTGDPERASHP